MYSCHVIWRDRWTAWCMINELVIFRAGIIFDWSCLVGCTAASLESQSETSKGNCADVSALRNWGQNKCRQLLKVAVLIALHNCHGHGCSNEQFISESGWVQCLSSPISYKKVGGSRPRKLIRPWVKSDLPSEVHLQFRRLLFMHPRNNNFMWNISVRLAFGGP